MWFHIGYIDIKVFRFTLQRMSFSHRSAWHTL